MAGLNHSQAGQLALALGATFLRVNATLLIGAAWTIPAGVAIGFSPRLARVAQPLAQIAASVPATALFPVILLVLIRLGGGLGIGSIVLLLLGTQWYIPVSYTHLDVYKRQPWDRVRFFISSGLILILPDFSIC